MNHFYERLSHILTMFKIIINFLTFCFVCWELTVLVETTNANTIDYPIAQQLYICLAIWTSIDMFKLFVVFCKNLVIATTDPHQDKIEVNCYDNNRTLLSEIFVLAPIGMYFWTWIRYADRDGWMIAHNTFPELTNLLFTLAIYSTIIYSLILFMIVIMQFHYKNPHVNDDDSENNDTNRLNYKSPSSTIVVINGE